MHIELTRKELYDRVWAEPMQKLGKQFGLSDVGLAKTCKRYDIPVPPRGYWAKKQVGRADPQPPLPAAPPKGLGNKVVFDERAQAAHRFNRPVSAEASPPDIHPLIVAESDPTNEIVVPEDLRIRHPLLRATREAWRTQSSAAFRWNNPLPEHLTLDVGKESQGRALRLLQALFSALERRAHTISRGDRGQILAKVLDETCEMALRERLRQTRTPPSKDPYRRPYDLTPTGELELRIEQPFRRVTVRDTTTLRLEQQLNSAVVRLIEAALGHKARRAADERARDEQAAREKRIALAKQRAREERDRAKRFLRLAAASARHRRLAAFAGEMREAVGAVGEGTELARWLGWIDAYVTQADPLAAFRERRPFLTLYHCASTWAVDDIVRGGFSNREHGYGEDRDPASVDFADVPLVGTHGGTRCIVVTVPEEDALPYEIRHADKSFRRFRMPEEVVNRFERRLHENGS